MLCQSSACGATIDRPGDVVGITLCKPSELGTLVSSCHGFTVFALSRKRGQALLGMYLRQPWTHSSWPVAISCLICQGERPTRAASCLGVSRESSSSSSTISLRLLIDSDMPFSASPSTRGEIASQLLLWIHHRFPHPLPLMWLGFSSTTRSRGVRHR